MQGITAHMMVKNEDCWVWYAIQSILPFVDTFLITDTGSSDNTIEFIKQIHSKKIHFTQEKTLNRDDITRVRNQQVANTQTDWIWIIDGDEVYPQSLCEEIIHITHKKNTGVVVKRHDLLGDVYHAQSEKVGSYEMYGRAGHFSLRLLNLKQIDGLVYKGDYPLEGFYDSQGKSLLEFDRQKFDFTAGKYFHAGYLRRSSLGANITNTFNRHKYKIEKGMRITDTLPEVFLLPIHLGCDPKEKRGLGYELASSIITPIKQMKRKLLK